MHIKRLPSGAIRLLLRTEELARFGLNFTTLSAQDRRTKTCILRLLHTVCRHEHIPSGMRFTVEAAPLDGGCLLLITPQQLTIGAVAVRLRTAAALWGLAQALNRRRSQRLADAIYEWDDAYYVLLYGESPDPMLAAILHEFADAVSTRPSDAAKIAEYGTPLAIGNALAVLEQQVTAPGSDG